MDLHDDRILVIPIADTREGRLTFVQNFGEVVGAKDFSDVLQFQLVTKRQDLPPGFLGDVPPDFLHVAVAFLSGGGITALISVLRDVLHRKIAVKVKDERTGREFTYEGPSLNQDRLDQLENFVRRSHPNLLNEPGASPAGHSGRGGPKKALGTDPKRRRGPSPKR